MWRYYLAAALAVIFFIAPVVYIIVREIVLKKKESARKAGLEKGIKKRKAEPVKVSAVAKVTAVLALPIPLVLYLSDLSFSFNPPDVSGFKVSFKHSGKRVADCDEAELIRKEGERYRQELKDKRQVAMSMEKLAKCPRERHPVVLEVYLNGEKLLDGTYPPTGIKKDLASYVYEDFKIPPGPYRLDAKLFRSGDMGRPDYTLSAEITVAPGRITLLRFDEKSDSLVIE